MNPRANALTSARAPEPPIVSCSSFATGDAHLGLLLGRHDEPELRRVRERTVRVAVDRGREHLGDGDAAPRACRAHDAEVEIADARCPA